MSKVGLAWDLERTPEVRIQAKMNDVKASILEERKTQLNLIESKIDHLITCLYSKINEFEHSSTAIKNKLKKSYEETLESLNKLAKQLHSSIQLSEQSSEKLLKIANQQIREAEYFITKLYNALDGRLVK